MTDNPKNFMELVPREKLEKTQPQQPIQNPDKEYDLLIFIGRFQPFHFGHQRVVDKALTLSKRVLMLLGSANVSRSERNPFTFEEREQMIRDCYPRDRLYIKPLNDVMYNDTRWVEQVQRLVNEEILQIPNVHEIGLENLKIGLVGCEKDHTSYYLKLFPTWWNEGVEFFDPISATDIRDKYFSAEENHFLGWHDKEQISFTTKAFLREFSKTDDYKTLVEEIAFNKNYDPSGTKALLKKLRELDIDNDELSALIKHHEENGVGYDRKEQTVDAVIIQSGHVLLVRRRSAPGKGKWALPGGFLEITEKMLDGMIRELREETKIKVPEPVLRGSVVKSKTYDHPNRSDRGRLITQAYLIKLQDQTELPKVKGSSDADKAKWVPLAELDPKMLFEDHYFIIKDMIGEL